MDKIKEIVILAYSSELTGLKLYSQLRDKKLDDDEIFSEIANIRQKGCELLEQCISYFEIDKAQISAMPQLIPDNLDDALIVSISYELGIISLYKGLCHECDNDNVRDLFFRLWATSVNEFMPCLKLKLSQTFNQNKTANIQSLSSESLNDKMTNFQKDISQISQKLQDVVQGKADKDDIANILNNPQFAFFSGAALGALGVASILKNQKDKQDEE